MQLLYYILIYIYKCIGNNRIKRAKSLKIKREYAMYKSKLLCGLQTHIIMPMSRKH